MYAYGERLEENTKLSLHKRLLGYPVRSLLVVLPDEFPLTGKDKIQLGEDR